MRIAKLLAVTTLALFFPLLAGASTITVDFKGTTKGVGGLAEGIWLGQGTDVTGSISYDSALVDLIAGSTYDKFQSNVGPESAWSMTFEMGGVSRTLTQTDFAVVFILFSTNGQYSFQGAGNGLSISGAGLEPLDGTAPDWAPDLSVVTGNTKKGYYRETGNRLYFNLTEMSVRAPVSAMPEPGAALLFGLGILLVGRGTQRRA